MLLLDIFSYYSGGLAAGVIVIVAIIVLVVILIPAIFYLLTLQNTLKAIQPQHRKMEPGMVWLMLIPLFNLVWHFIIVSRISDSIRDELIARGETPSDRPTYGIGLAASILFVCGRIPVPFLGGATSLAGLVCWIIYWVKVNEYKNKFQREPFEPKQDSEIFDYVKPY